MRIALFIVYVVGVLGVFEYIDQVVQADSVMKSQSIVSQAAQNDIVFYAALFVYAMMVIIIQGKYYMRAHA